MQKPKYCPYDGKCLICSNPTACINNENAARAEAEALRQKILENKGKCTLWYNKQFCDVCKDYKKCCLENGSEYRNYEQKNTVINKYPDGSFEIVFYKEAFDYLADCENLDKVDRSRLLKLNEDGVLIKAKDDITLQQLQKSIRNADKRALDTFWGYALSNEWHFFITLTLSPEFVDRNDDFAVKTIWSTFQKWCKRKNENVKILCVPERHEPSEDYPKGALHFHCLIADITFNLELAKNSKGDNLFFSNGLPKFKLLDWQYGFSQVAVLPPEDNKQYIIGYMINYVTKSSNIGYNQKRYYRTQNLNFKEKGYFLLNGGDLDEIIKGNGLELKKETDRFIIYRSNKTI